MGGRIQTLHVKDPPGILTSHCEARTLTTAPPCKPTFISNKFLEKFKQHCQNKWNYCLRKQLLFLCGTNKNVSFSAGKSVVFHSLESHVNQFAETSTSAQFKRKIKPHCTKSYIIGEIEHQKLLENN